MVWAIIPGIEGPKPRSGCGGMPQAGVVNLLYLFIAPNFVHTPRRMGTELALPAGLSCQRRLCGAQTDQ